jgi:hypothetical protein
LKAVDGTKIGFSSPIHAVFVHGHDVRQENKFLQSLPGHGLSQENQASGETASLWRGKRVQQSEQLSGAWSRETYPLVGLWNSAAIGPYCISNLRSVTVERFPVVAQYLIALGVGKSPATVHRRFRYTHSTHRHARTHQFRKQKDSVRPSAVFRQISKLWVF